MRCKELRSAVAPVRRSCTTLTQQAFAPLPVAPTEEQKADRAATPSSAQQARNIPLALCAAAPSGAHGVTTLQPVPKTARLPQLLWSATHKV